MLFDAGPEGQAWERNAGRLACDLASVERIQLSHWHRDHSGQFLIPSIPRLSMILIPRTGGMLKAVEMITSSKMKNSMSFKPVIVDLHPSRPEYRGINFGEISVSLQADPSFSEIEASGGSVEKNEKVHTVLDDMFLISGEIPRVTAYEKGVTGGIRYDSASGNWTKDEEIKDERFLMCNLRGRLPFHSILHY